MADIEFTPERKAKILAMLLADEMKLPSPLLLGDTNPWGEAEVYALWLEVEHDAMERWIEAHPGSRPLPWWWWRAPERMRHLADGSMPRRDGVLPLSPYGAPGRSWRGTVRGLPCPELPDYQGTWRGLPLDQPGEYESEAAYLDRHGLLSATERRRLLPDALQPITWRATVSRAAVDD
jgi:hypothetical protein